MSGARPLDNIEHEKVKESFDSLRNSCLYLLAKNTGFRISELLTITIGQVYNKEYVKVDRKNVKGKTESREVILNKEAKDAIQSYLSSLEVIELNVPLFVSRNGKGMKPITRFRAHQIYKAAFENAQLSGSVSTHSARKTWAMNVYERSNHDLVLTSKAIGHKNLTTTVKYLPVNQFQLNKIILGEE